MVWSGVPRHHVHRAVDIRQAVHLLLPQVDVPGGLDALRDRLPRVRRHPELPGLDPGSCGGRSGCSWYFLRSALDRGSECSSSPTSYVYGIDWGHVGYCLCSGTSVSLLALEVGEVFGSSELIIYTQIGRCFYRSPLLALVLLYQSPLRRGHGAFHHLLLQGSRQAC